MNSLRENAGDWQAIVGYAILILLYFIILKLLLNAIQQLTKKHRNQRSVIDIDIHTETGETRVDDSMTGLDIYGHTVALLRIIIMILAIIGAVLIITIKLNFLLAIAICAAAVIITWRLVTWKRPKQGRYDVVDFLLEKLASVGGNVGTAILLVVALIVVAVGLLFLG